MSEIHLNISLGECKRVLVIHIEKWVASLRTTNYLPWNISVRDYPPSRTLLVKDCNWVQFYKHVSSVKEELRLQIPLNRQMDRQGDSHTINIHPKTFARETKRRKCSIKIWKHVIESAGSTNGDLMNTSKRSQSIQVWEVVITYLVCRILASELALSRMICAVVLASLRIVSASVISLGLSFKATWR